MLVNRKNEEEKPSIKQIKIKKILKAFYLELEPN